MPKRKTAATSRRSFVKSLALGAGALAEYSRLQGYGVGFSPVLGEAISDAGTQRRR